MINSVGANVNINDVQMQTPVNRQYVSMRGNDLERIPESDRFESDNKNKTGKRLGIITAALVALAGAGALFVTHRGKNILNKSDATLKEKFEAGWKDIFKKGKKDSKSAANKTEEAAKNENIKNQENYTSCEINTKLINDENLLEAAKNAKIDFLNIGSVPVFLNNFNNKLYRQYLTKLSKCNSPEELKAAIEQIKNAETNINPKALDFANDNRLSGFLDEYIAKVNKDGTFLNRIDIPSNATSQEKMSLLLSEEIKLSKQDLGRTLYLDGKTDLDTANITKDVYDEIMKQVKQRLEYLS